MATWLCVTAAEVADHLRGPYAGHVGDIVVAAPADEIYYYHVDSCMAVALYGVDPADRPVIVGMHIVMLMDVGPAQWPTPAEGAAHYAQVASARLRGYRFTDAAFIGDSGDWTAPAQALATSLQMPDGRSRFYDVGVSDVWAFGGGQILVHQWAGRPCPWYDDASRPVSGQGGNVLRQEGGTVL